VDGGRELEVPVRVASGQRLYSDVAYYFGPLAPWANALVLRVAGHLFFSLEIVGVGIAIGILCLLYFLTSRAGSARSALVAVSLTAAVCVGGQQGCAFIFPYAFASLYALFGTLVAACGLTSKSEWLRAGLFFLGLTIVLTARLDFGIALSFIGILSLRLLERRARPVLVSAILMALLAAVILYALALRGCSLKDALVAGPLSFVRPPARWRVLYRDVAGISTWYRTAGKVFVSLLVGVGILCLARGWSSLSAGGGKMHRAMRLLGLAIALGVGAILGLVAAKKVMVFGQALVSPILPIPLLSLLLAATLLLRPQTPKVMARFVLFSTAALWGSRVAFSLTLGPRMSPYCGPALPCAVGAAAVLVFDLVGPRLGDERNFSRNMTAVFLSMGTFYLVRVAVTNHGKNLQSLETHSGTLRLPREEAAATEETIEFLGSLSPGGLVSLPESGFFQFVTGRTNPLREEQVLPGMLAGSDESRLIARLRSAAPAAILIINRPASEYGQKAFGEDYAKGLFQAITTRSQCGFSTIRDDCRASVGGGRFFIHAYTPR
jgi:hypothetical protein